MIYKLHFHISLVVVVLDITLLRGPRYDDDSDDDDDNDDDEKCCMFNACLQSFVKRSRRSTRTETASLQPKNSVRSFVLSAKIRPKQNYWE